MVATGCKFTEPVSKMSKNDSIWVLFEKNSNWKPCFQFLKQTNIFETGSVVPNLINYA